MTAESNEPLTSWTRTLNEEDAIKLIEWAEPGMTIEAWSERGHTLLPQASHARRRELIRIVLAELLDTSGSVIVDSAWRRLFCAGSAHRRLGLLYGRLWGYRPLVDRALSALVHPALERADRPLAPHEADVITGEDWDQFLRDHLKPGVPEDAFTKTRSTIQGALRSVGVLSIESSRRRTTRACHSRPDPLAFAWVLANEIVGRGEESETWAVRQSFAARLFCPRSDYAATCIDAGVAAEILRRGHLMGQTRLFAGPELLGRSAGE